MNDLIIKEPELKKITLSAPFGDIPAGAVLEGRLEYMNPALDNNPTPLNKATLLSDDTADFLGVPKDERFNAPTVNLALHTLALNMGSGEGSWGRFIHSITDFDIIRAIGG